MRTWITKSCAFWTVSAGLLSLNAQLQAQITCTQIGSEVFVAGTDSADSLYIGCFLDQVYIESQAALGQNWFFSGVSKVWVATGDGADEVTAYADYGLMDFDIETGNDPDRVQCFLAGTYGVSAAVRSGDGDDNVEIAASEGEVEMLADTGSGNDSIVCSTGFLEGGAINVVAGNGQDYVFVYTDENYSDVPVLVDTGNGDDMVEVFSYSWVRRGVQLGVQLGNGNDVIAGPPYGSSGTVDGGRGADNCSGFLNIGGKFSIINCEN